MGADGGAGLREPVGEGAQSWVDDAQGLNVGVPAVTGLPALLGRGEFRADRAGLAVSELQVSLGRIAQSAGRPAGRQRVCDALSADRGWPHALLTASTQRFREALDRLLRDAKQAGAIRADVQAGDLSAIAAGGAALCAARGDRDRDRGLRLARLMLDAAYPGSPGCHEICRVP